MSRRLTSSYDVVIVGAGHAGAQCAAMLRQLGFGGTIALVGEEPELPYERPPLSKDYLSGEKTFERLLIRPAAFWRERSVTMLLGQRVVAVDPAAKAVVTEQDEAIGYGRLVWATGGRPRLLDVPGRTLSGIHAVRNRADVDAILAGLEKVERIAVIGGGYIGLEAAAVLRKLGKQVVLLEALDRVLARVAGETLSRFYESEHRAHGVDVRLGSATEAFAGEDGRIVGVRLAGGDVVPCDMAIVGIGIAPAVEPLLAAGAEGGNGVAVDDFCRTSLPDIYAIGDCALHANVHAHGPPIRIESVQNAIDQANVAARSIMGGGEPYRAVPWFWSNQYDLRLQTVGLSAGHDAAVVRGDPATRSFSIIYLRAGRVIALDCVNATKDYVQGKALVVAAAAADVAKLAEPGVALKELSSHAPAAAASGRSADGPLDGVSPGSHALP